MSQNSILRDLAHSRMHFFSNARLYRRRDQLTRHFLETETAFIDVLTRERSQPVTITFPITIPNDFMNPVSVLPTAAQIANEVQDFMSLSQQTCSICQEAIVSDGARLRVCQHVYHRSCIQSWFGASVRCPICRRDIREGQASQTSSGAIETPPLQTSQWGGEDSQE